MQYEADLKVSCTVKKKLLKEYSSQKFYFLKSLKLKRNFMKKREKLRYEIVLEVNLTVKKVFEVLFVKI